MAEFNGTAQADSLFGTTGSDVISGGGSGDALHGGPGDDVLSGGDGDDTMNGESGDDVVDGGAGNDSLRDGAGNDLVHGGEGDDQILSDIGSDQLYGDGGNDQFDISRIVSGSSISVFGGAGADSLLVGSLVAGNSLVADLGDGSDVFSFSALRGSVTLTLGAGRDLVSGSSDFRTLAASGNPIRITDWQGGPDGDFISVASFVSRGTGWRGSTNPFSAGYLTLVQSGSDVVLSYSPTANGVFADIVVFQNIAIAAFSSENFGGWSHDGSVASGTHVVGTDSDFERLTGGSGDDLIEGGDGIDVITGGAYGGAGNDELRGGAGDDTLVGGVGDDVLRGGEGNDYLEDSFGNDSFYGEGGDDEMTVQSGGAVTVYVSGGDGNDYLWINTSPSQLTIDAGAGDDRIELWGIADVVTLGDGTDAVFYYASSTAQTKITRITDFAPGNSGDRIEIGAAYARLGADPFGSGHLRLVQDGADVLVQYDADGTSAGYGWITLISLGDSHLAAFTPYNLSVASFEGVAGAGLVLAGTAGDDRMHGAFGADSVGGGGGSDFIEGLGGNDALSGGLGDDRLDGGDGNDLLEGGEGADTFSLGDGDDIAFGGGGNDSITVEDYGNDIVHGGDGDDYIDLWRFTSNEHIVLNGDAGNDRILVRPYIGGSTVLQVDVDAGSGDDRVILETRTASRITLGAGRDVLELGRALPLDGSVVVTDFQAGEGGDMLDFDAWLNGFAQTLDPNANPFLTGWMRLVQSGSHVLVQIWNSGWVTAVTLQNVDMTALRAANLDNYQLLIHHGTESADILDGSFLADSLYGEGGDDTIRGFASSDSLYGGEGDDSIQGGDGDDKAEGGAGNDILAGDGGSDALFGGLGNDGLDGGEGNDNLHSEDFDSAPQHDIAVGGAGLDVLHVDFSGLSGAPGATLTMAADAAGGYSGIISAGMDHDVAFSAVEAFAVTGTEAADHITSGDGADLLIGRLGDDVLSGGGGSDRLIGEDGADTMIGGSGDDSYEVDSLADVLIENPGEGSDRVESRLAAYTLPDNIETLIGLLDTGQTLIGNGLDNGIQGGAGDDILDGGAGADLLRGGNGNDIYYVGGGDFFSDTGGIDEIRTFAAIAGLSSSNMFENLTGLADTGQVLNGNTIANTIRGGGGSDQLNGGGGVDTLYGGAGNDSLDGGTGGDSMRGEQGDDTYVVDNAGDIVIEDAGQGTDEIRTALAAYSLAALGNIESLTGTNAAGQILTGNGSANVITGAGGADRIDGAAGADTMRGGLGNDVYIVDDSGDVVDEAPGAGTDEARTGLATYALAANVELLTATSDAAHDFRGNAGHNVVTGGGGNDLLRLYDGGDDIVLAGAGNDNIFFIGSLTAADVVNGGDGVDTLVIQGPYGSLALSANVTRIENVSILGGNNTSFGEPGTNRYDYVLTTNDANFAAGVQARINGAALLAGEDFTFDGSAETDAKYVVYGGKGKDTLTGGLGNDIFFYAEERFSSGDVVDGGSGYDGMFLRGNYTIDFTAPGYTGLFTSIENLTLTSATDERYARGGGTEFDYNLTLSNAIVKPGEQLTISGTLLMASETMVLDASQEADGLLRLFGGKAGDTLKGGGQNDLLHGGLGADILAGNGGADAFRYQEVVESNNASLDQILDFTPGTDKIEIDRIDANTLLGGDQGFSWIGSGAFSGVAGQLRAYQQGGTWYVEGDTNGDSLADLVIALTLQGPTPLGAGDFLL